MRTKIRKSIGILLSLLMVLSVVGAAVPASAADDAANAEFEALKSQTIAAIHSRLAGDPEPDYILNCCLCISLVSEKTYIASVSIEEYRQYFTSVVASLDLLEDILEFDAYKEDRCMYLYSLFAGTEREEEIIIGSVRVSSVAGTEFDEDLTLEQNKANIDAAVDAALASSAVPAPDGVTNEEFEALKSLFVGHFYNKIAENDVPTAIITLCSGITELLTMPYDEDMSMDENEEELDDFADDVVTQAKKCRLEAYAAEKGKTLYAVFADVEDEAVIVAGSECVINICWTEYDAQLSLEENKANVDASVAAALARLAELGVPPQDPDEPDAPVNPDAPDKPQEENLCKWCGEKHTGFWGKIVGFFHSVLYFFARLFGRR